MGACAQNMQSDSAEIKPAQCCIKLVFHLTYTMMHGNTKLKSHQKLWKKFTWFPPYKIQYSKKAVHFFQICHNIPCQNTTLRGTTTV